MIRGTNIDQDSRFKDKSQKMLNESTWPEKYDKKIDLTKVDMEMMKIWIEKRINQLLGYEDDVVTGTAFSLLQEYLQKSQKPNAKKIHVALSGLLMESTLIFISDLWDQLDEAQKNKHGIGKSLIEQKIKREKEEKKKLEEMENKKRKVKGYRFDVVINRYTDTRDPRDKGKRHSEERSKRKERYYSRSRSREKETERERDRDRRRKRNKNRSRSRDRDKQRNRDKSRSKDKNRDRRSRDKERDRDRDKGRDRERDKKKGRDAQKDRERDNEKDGQRHKKAKKYQERSEKRRHNEQKHRKKQRNERRGSASSDSSQVVSSSQSHNS